MPRAKSCLFNAFLGMIVLIFVSVAACKDAEIQSRWLDREVAVDGDDSEWGGRAACRMKCPAEWGEILPAAKADFPEAAWEARAAGEWTAEARPLRS